MLAVIKDKAGFGLSIAEVKAPEPGQGEVLIKPWSCGICGSDVSKYQWREHQQKSCKVPIILGHEFAGEIVALGEGVSEYQVGDRVAVEPFIPCQSCYMCRLGHLNLCQRAINLGSHRDGAMAELVTVPTQSLFRISNQMSPEAGAMLEPMAVAVHTLSRSGLKPGESVCIVGPGPIGLLHLALFKLAGGSPVTVIGTPADAYRLERAQQMGADKIICNDEANWMGQARAVCGEAPGYDLVMECAGHPDALITALELVRPAGRVMVVGSFDEATPIRPHSMLKHREVTMIGSKGRSRSDWHQAIRLLETGALDISPLIDMRVPLAEAIAGFEAVAQRKAMKVLIDISK